MIKNQMGLLDRPCLPWQGVITGAINVKNGSSPAALGSAG